MRSPVVSRKRHISALGTTLALLHRHYITGRILYQGSLGVGASRRFTPGSGQVHAHHGEDENGDITERTVTHAEGVRQWANAQRFHPEAAGRVPGRARDRSQRHRRGLGSGPTRAASCEITRSVRRTAEQDS